MTGTPTSLSVHIIKFIRPLSCAVAEIKHANSMTNYVIFHQHHGSIGIKESRKSGPVPGNLVFGAQSVKILAILKPASYLHVDMNERGEPAVSYR